MEFTNESVLDRFIRYVKIDTQSDPKSTSFPSTEKQKDLARLLVDELLRLGITDAHLDEHGYVYATVLSNTEKESVPVICFCSHMDTSPDVTGEGVKPIVHTNYDGSDLVLPDDTNQVIRMKDHPDLAAQIGNDIVTASGTTLLGADNKAGVAEIMTAVAALQADDTIKHGTIKILFTPDEEVGRGTEHVNLQKLGADFGYTIDGETLGSIEDETFSADAVVVTIYGVSTHPGFAKDKLVNAIKVGSQVIAALPSDRLSPETTEAKQGFIHPVGMEGGQDKCVLEFIIRDFTTAGLEDHERFLHEIVDKVVCSTPGASFTFETKEQYRNMVEILNSYPQVVNNAITAMKEVGIEPKKQSIRGGTDGSRLSFMGLPCPNIFAGEHAFHSKLEWVSVQDMEKAVATIVKLCEVWEQEN